MSLKELRIVADERERKCGIPSLLKKAGVGLEVMTLPVGDYIVASETVVERKSTYDLVSSVFDGRLFDQCSRLREHFGRPVLVVEGNVDELANVTENPMVFYGALSRVALDYGIPVVPTPDAAHTAKLLVSMAAQKRSKPGPFLKKIRKHNDVARQQLSVLCSLPGVGETLASRMLERFGNPMAALEASATDLGKVPGLGRSRADRIRRMLDRDAAESTGAVQSRLPE